MGLDDDSYITKTSTDSTTKYTYTSDYTYGTVTIKSGSYKEVTTSSDGSTEESGEITAYDSESYEDITLEYTAKTDADGASSLSATLNGEAIDVSEEASLFILDLVPMVDKVLDLINTVNTYVTANCEVYQEIYTGTDDGEDYVEYITYYFLDADSDGDYDEDETCILTDVLYDEDDMVEHDYNYSLDGVSLFGGYKKDYSDELYLEAWLTASLDGVSYYLEACSHETPPAVYAEINGSSVDVVGDDDAAWTWIIAKFDKL